MELSMSVCCEIGVAIVESDHGTNGKGTVTTTTELTVTVGERLGYVSHLSGPWWAGDEH